MAGLFKKGQSGNPGGRPKLPEEVKKILEDASLKGVKRLVKLIDSDDERIALAAIETVQNRIWGKPAQAVEHSGTDGGPMEFVQWQVVWGIDADAADEASTDPLPN